MYGGDIVEKRGDISENRGDIGKKNDDITCPNLGHAPYLQGPIRIQHELSRSRC